MSRSIACACLMGCTWLEPESSDDLVDIGTIDPPVTTDTPPPTDTPPTSDTGTTDTGTTTEPPPDAPSAPVIAITPAFAADWHDLSCVILELSIDPDGKPVTYALEWSVDGIPYEGPTETRIIAGDTIANSQTTVGQSWTCTLTPDNGEVTGPAGVVTGEVLTGLQITEDTEFDEGTYEYGVVELIGPTVLRIRVVEFAVGSFSMDAEAAIDGAGNGRAGGPGVGSGILFGNYGCGGGGHGGDGGDDTGGVDGGLSYGAVDSVEALEGSGGGSGGGAVGGPGVPPCGSTAKRSRSTAWST